MRTIIASLFFITMLAGSAVSAQDSVAAHVPDTVKAGVYITSIHNIDFKEKEYTISLWLWLSYRNRKFDFLQNLEVPGAKSVNRSFATVDSSGEKAYVLMKLQCVMKDEWAIDKFPFDRQRLRFSIENSQFDSKALVFVADTFGKHFDERFTLRKWHIDSISIATGVRVYETGFGDAAVKVPHTEYSNYRVRMVITRNAMSLFWKMFLGMYIAFLIAYMCFYIHPENIDSRFSLSVGALFAVVGNKYIVDSSLPESTTFTLVDSLHGLTLAFILVIMIANAHALRLVKTGQVERSHRFDRIYGVTLLLAYGIINCALIYVASH